MKSDHDSSINGMYVIFSFTENSVAFLSFVLGGKKKKEKLSKQRR